MSKNSVLWFWNLNDQYNNLSMYLYIYFFSLINQRKKIKKNKKDCKVCNSLFCFHSKNSFLNNFFFYLGPKFK